MMILELRLNKETIETNFENQEMTILNLKF